MNLLLQYFNNMQSGAQQVSIPDPVLYAPIQFIDDGEVISYTDCWEISVLRFLHLLFGQAGTISQEKLSKYIDFQSKHCLDLIAYFTANPTYQMSQQFYKTEEGLAIRAKWCQFLNTSGLFYLKLQGKYEVAATISNTLAFIRGFFPKIQANFNEIQPLTMDSLTSDRLFTSYEQILNQIYQQLSPTHKLTVSMDSLVHDGADWVYFTIIQKLSINGVHLLDWEISECYTKQGQEIGARQGGHSDYRYFLSK